MATILPRITPQSEGQIKMPKTDIHANPNHASEFYKRLVSIFNRFNKELDKENEVGAQICNFGQKIEIYITDINYWDPSLVIFYGMDSSSGNPVQLIQHVSQINILLVKLPRKNPDEPKQPIGFKTWDEFESSENEK